jgi:hypothetical protein
MEDDARDRMQNSAAKITVESSIVLSDRLREAGLGTVEGGGFLGARRLKPMAEADAVPMLRPRLGGGLGDPRQMTCRDGFAAAHRSAGRAA